MFFLGLQNINDIALGRSVSDMQVFDQMTSNSECSDLSPLMMQHTSGRKSSLAESSNLGKPRRGRKSLKTILAEAAANPQTVIENMPRQLVDAFKEMNVDFSQLTPESIPELIEQYNRHRNSAASARYRKRKNEETSEMAAEIDKLRAELRNYRKRCQDLEAELALLKSMNRANTTNYGRQ